jgi:GtrA-like protein
MKSEAIEPTESLCGCPPGDAPFPEIFGGRRDRVRHRYGLPMAFALHTDRTLAKGISFSLAVVSNYMLNRFWTHPDSRSKSVLAQITQFAVVSLVGLGINLVVFNWADHVA